MELIYWNYGFWSKRWVNCVHISCHFLLYSFQGQWEDSIRYTGPSISFFVYISIVYGMVNNKYIYYWWGSTNNRGNVVIIHWLVNVVIIHGLVNVVIIHWLVNVVIVHGLVNVVIIHWLVNVVIIHWLVNVVIIHWLVNVVIVHWLEFFSGFLATSSNIFRFFVCGFCIVTIT